MVVMVLYIFSVFKQKTAYEMRISDWSSDVCSSDLPESGAIDHVVTAEHGVLAADLYIDCSGFRAELIGGALQSPFRGVKHQLFTDRALARSEEHTSELQSLMRISYAVFCLKKKKTHTETHNHQDQHVSCSQLTQ